MMHATVTYLKDAVRHVQGASNILESQGQYHLHIARAGIDRAIKDLERCLRHIDKKQREESIDA